MYLKKSLSECSACEIVIEKKRGYVIFLHHSPSQNQSELEHFLLSLENQFGNTRNQDLAFTIQLAGFNARSKS